jgi:predicted nucleic acid-binding protein
MPEGEVVSNTSPLLYLHQIGRLDLLRRLYERVVAPAGVRDELERGAEQGIDVPRLDEIPWLEVRRFREQTLLPAFLDLGRGEAEAIGLALLSPGSLLVLDEALGRRIARLNKLKVTGTLGVLLRAKEQGWLSEVLPALEALQRTTMYLSDSLIVETLRKAEEI